jgi:hypothetical protein
MCQLTTTLRRLLGIRPYVWKPRPAPRTGVRGVEVNGTAAGWRVSDTTYGLTPEECRMLEKLEGDQRLIRQMIADVKRARCRGQRE